MPQFNGMPWSILLIVVLDCCLLTIAGPTITRHEGPTISRVARSIETQENVPPVEIDSLCFKPFNVTRFRMKKRDSLRCSSIGQHDPEQERLEASLCPPPTKLVDYSASSSDQPVCLTEECPSNMRHILMESGQWECDCKPFHAFWYQAGLNQYEGGCHPVKRRGPCPPSHLLMLVAPGFTNNTQLNTEGVCVPQPCPDGEYNVILEEEGRDTVLLVPQGTPGATCEPLEQRGGLCSTVGPDKLLRLIEDRFSCVNPSVKNVMSTAPLRNRQLCAQGKTAVLQRNGEFRCFRIVKP